MANRSRFEIAKKDIIAYFEQDKNRVFSRTAISEILTSQRGFWRLSQTTSTDNFIDLLLKYTKLKKHILKDDKEKFVYSWGEASVYEVALALKSKSYLSHYTAMYLHDLTDQIPKTIYVNHEQALKTINNDLKLSQLDVDKAFSKEQRKSNDTILFDSYNITFINGKFSNRLGVIEYEISPGNKVHLTGIERTLIDIAVRPQYAGGVYEVLEAYRRAAQTVSVNKMLGMLKKLNYIYPYHQVIGFYLEQAGNYRISQINLLKKWNIDIDFYLTHQMGESEYSKQWRLYYPKDFIG